MFVNVSRAATASDSIMAPVYKQAAQSVIANIMQYSGIKSATLKRVEIANQRKQVLDVEYFYEASPESDLKAFSFLVQQPIADLMALFGIVTINLTGTDEEFNGLIKSLKQLESIREAAKISSAESAAAKVEPEQATKEAAENKTCVCTAKSCSRKTKTKKSTKSN